MPTWWLATIVVQDSRARSTYTNDVDYVTGSDTNGLTTLLLTTNSAIAEGSTNLVSYESWIRRPGRTEPDGDGDVTVARAERSTRMAKAMSAGSARARAGPPEARAAAAALVMAAMAGRARRLDGGGMPYGINSAAGVAGQRRRRWLRGHGGAGGGNVKLVVGGTLRVDGSVSRERRQRHQRSLRRRLGRQHLAERPKPYRDRLAVGQRRRRRACPGRRRRRWPHLSPVCESQPLPGRLRHTAATAMCAVARARFTRGQQPGRRPGAGG